MSQYLGPDGQVVQEEPAQETVFLAAVNAVDGSVIYGPGLG